MLQVTQYQKTGKLSVKELPVPMVKSGGVLVRNAYSLISAGTERTSVVTAQASMIGKARSRPDLVKQVLDNMRRDGLIATYHKVQNRLDNYKELGYSSSGIVVESAAKDLRVGDRVACAGYAYHAEYVSVPRNLVCKIPEPVGFDEAAFTTLGAIALQGVRQAEVHMGETVAVVGLGLLGLITLQLLKANGCRVIGMDIARSNFSLARSLGCDVCLLSNRSAVRSVESLTKGHGTDAVIITASTPSNEPMELALHMARKRSTVVIVGAVRMDVPRAPFYEKELVLKNSCSYGPGRYDPSYEEGGNDYPLGYVRWTENRNMEAILSLLAEKKINTRALVTHTFAIKDAKAAYNLVTGRSKDRYLGILLRYPEEARPPKEQDRIVALEPHEGPRSSGPPVIGFIGAGNFAQSYLLPHLQRAGVPLKGVATSKPVNAKSVAHKFGFAYCSTDAEEVLRDRDITSIFVATRHDSHARYVVRALSGGKDVVVEKPLAINMEQLNEIRKAFELAQKKRRAHLLVGFNRRFSRPFLALQNFFAEREEPLSILYRVNAGFLPSSSWYQDGTQGGRFVGEGCHFVDCMSFLTGSRPTRIFAQAIPARDSVVVYSDNIMASLEFADGSIGSLLYLANGETTVPKEYCEVSSGGATAIMNNFTEVTFYKDRKKTRERYDGLKGHREEIDHFVRVLSGREEPSLSVASIFDTTIATLHALQSLRTGLPVAM